MGSYRVSIKKSAQKEIRRLPSKDIRSKVVDIIDDLENDPHPIDSKKIKGSNNLYRIRHGVYRIVYGVYKEELVVLVIRVRHRKEAYRDM